MNEGSISKRVSFAVELLTQLKHVNLEIAQSISNVQSYSPDFYEKLFIEKKAEIQGDIDKYNNNIEKVRKLNQEATNSINEWFELIKDPKQIKKISFPLIFIINKKKLTQRIKDINNEVSDIFIENRVIRERLATWEHQLELCAVKMINEEKDFKNYEALMRKKEAILSSLKYLLPTIPGICPTKLDPLNIDSLIEKVNCTEAYVTSP